MWYTMEYYSVIKKNDVFLVASTWMVVESIMLSEIRQRQIPYDFTYMCNLRNKTNKKTLNYRKQRWLYEEMWGWGIGGRNR